MLASTRDVPSIDQSGISLNANEVEPRSCGHIYNKMIAAVGWRGVYNSALSSATIQTVLRAMYDEVETRDERKVYAKEKN